MAKKRGRKRPETSKKSPGKAVSGTRKQRLLLALLSETSVAAACRSAGVPSSTGRRWLRDPAFNAEFAEAKRQVMSQALSRICRSVSDAISTLTEICNDKKQEGRDRVNAAGKLLDAAFKVSKLEDINRRLDAVESQTSQAENIRRMLDAVKQEAMVLEPSGA